MADDKQNYTKTGIDQSRDIVTRLRTGRPSVVYDIAQHAADEIERLGAELEQAKINLQQARTGRALRDLEQERQDRQRVEQSLIQTIARLCMDARDLRARNEQLEQQLAVRRTPTVRIDVDHETAAQKIADINRTIDRIFDELNAKDRHVETEP